MPYSDFDIAGLAAFLHMTPKLVERGAQRGRIPGRRVGGEWRFSRAEIHHWMEQRMGLLDDEELAHVEGALARRHPDTPPEQLSIADLLPIEAMAVPLKARTRPSVVSELTETAAGSGLLWDQEKMAEAVLAREAMMSTALDNGVALLHPRRPLSSILAEAFLAFGRTEQGIPFGGGGALTDLFFLICSTDDRTHLMTLARLSRLIGDATLLEEIRAAEDAETIHQLIRQREEAIEKS